MIPQDKIDFLRAKIRDYLVITLDEGVLEIEKASDIAQATLDILPDGMTDEQIDAAIAQLKQKFPDQEKIIHAAKIACEVIQAKEIVENEIVPMVKQGNLTAALDRINKINLQ